MCLSESASFLVEILWNNKPIESSNREATNDSYPMTSELSESVGFTEIMSEIAAEFFVIDVDYVERTKKYVE